MSAAAAYKRDHQTAKVSAGVRVNPGHWASISVHSFHRWTGEATVLTWCGITVELGDGGKLTTDLISCSGCGQASMQAFKGAA